MESESTQSGGTHALARRKRGRSITAVVCASLALSAMFGGVASAQESPAAPAIAPYDPANFNRGEASARADTFGFNVVQGNANIGMTYGISMAGYRDSTANSDARALDLGVFPTLFGVTQCDGSAPILNPATFPPLTLANSAAATSLNPPTGKAHLPGFGSNGPGKFVGTQTASATQLPSAKAVTDNETTDMGIVILVDGHSETTSSVSNDVREAHAVVTAKKLKVMGGLFTFDSPRWEATAKSGRLTETSGSFTFTKATVMGFPRTPEQALKDLKAFKKGLEDLLKPLGAKLELPKVVVEDNKVSVTPMSFKLVDLPLGTDLIAPFMAQIQPMREAYNKALLDKDCKNETDLMLMDVVLGVLSGSGSVEINAGGVEAWTDDTDFSVPPIEAPPAARTIAAVPAVAGTPGTPPSSYDEVIPGDYEPLGDTDLEFDPVDSSVDFDLPEVPTEVESAQTVAPKKQPQRELASAPTIKASAVETSTARSTAIAVGIIGLLCALGLTAGEHWKGRRSSRRFS